MILITGATGHLGSSIVEQLKHLISVDHFAVLVRNLDKAKALIDAKIEVRLGDFNDPDSLKDAFVGIEKLVLISTMENNRLDQHKTVVDAAQTAGVKHLIYTGLAIHDIQTSAVKELMISHFETEQYIQDSGMIYTFLRNTMYAEAIPQIIGQSITDIQLSAGLGSVPYALRSDMGKAIANLVLETGHENKTYHITGSEFYHYQEIAQMLTEITAQKVNYHALDEDEYIKHLESAKLPPFLIYLTAGTVADIKNHQYEIQSSDLEKLLGHPPTPLKDYLKQVYGS